MKKLLLLDDNLDMVRMVEDILICEGYEVRCATDSLGFLSIAEQYGPDLIMLNYSLERTNGGEVSNRIKAHPQLLPIPVIIFTADMQQGLNLYAGDCDAVISQPFDTEQILHTVNGLMKPETPRHVALDIFQVLNQPYPLATATNAIIFFNVQEIRQLDKDRIEGLNTRADDIFKKMHITFDFIRSILDKSDLHIEKRKLNLLIASASSSAY